MHLFAHQNRNSPEAAPPTDYPPHLLRSPDFSSKAQPTCVNSACVSSSSPPTNRLNRIESSWVSRFLSRTSRVLEKRVHSVSIPPAVFFGTLSKNNPHTHAFDKQWTQSRWSQKIERTAHAHVRHTRSAASFPSESSIGLNYSQHRRQHEERSPIEAPYAGAKDIVRHAHTFGGLTTAATMTTTTGWGSKSVYSLHNSSFNLSACFCFSSDSSCYSFASLLLLLLYHTWLIFSLASSWTCCFLPWPHSWLSLWLWKKLVSKQFFFWSFLLLLLLPTLRRVLPSVWALHFQEGDWSFHTLTLISSLFCCCCCCFEKGDKKNVLKENRNLTIKEETKNLFVSGRIPFARTPVSWALVVNSLGLALSSLVRSSSS